MRTKRAKWRRWHDSIGADLRRMAAWRAQREGLTPGLAESSRAFVDEIYAHALAMGVRRQLKAGSRDVSLIRLLGDIASDPASLPAVRDGAEVRARLAGLRRDVRPAESFADRVVAHADRRGRGGPPLAALHQALDRLLALHAECGQWLEA